MDRNTLFAFFLISLVLIFTPKYLELVSPKKTTEPTVAPDSLKNSFKDKIVLEGDCQSNIYTKDTIPENKNKYIIELLTVILKHVKHIDNQQDYYLKDIDQLYVQMDKYENKRYIVVAFIYDIRNYYTMKIAVDFVRKFGPYSNPRKGYFDPKNIKVGLLHLSDRNHTNAEIVWWTNIAKSWAEKKGGINFIYFDGDYINSPNKTFKWNYLTRGKSSVKINFSNRR